MPGVWYYGNLGNADERMQYWIDNPPTSICLDIETIDLKERMPLGIGISPSPLECFYCELYPEPNIRFLEAIKPMLASGMTVKVGSNLLFDLGVMPLVPIISTSIDRFNIFDINVAARLKGFKFTALDYLAPLVLNKQHQSMQEVWKQHSVKNNMELINKVGHRALADKCAEDCMLEHELYHKWGKEIRQQYGQYFVIEMAVIPLLVDMALKGIALDTESVQGLIISYSKDVAQLYQSILAYGIDNPNSPGQVGYILAKRGNFLKFTRGKKQYSTRNEELEFCEDDLAKKVLEYRHKNTFLTRYLLPIQDKDRFYTEYYMDTDVGRLNSRNMNIQNIPAANEKLGDPGARFIMMPDSGLWISGDYAQEHLYIIANRSKDPDMLKVYYDPAYEGKRDIHQYVASELNIPRKIAKTINYALAYGATPKTLSEQAKIKDLRVCSNLLDKWFGRFRTAGNWIKAIQAEGLKTGWAVETLFGRRIKLPEENPDGMARKAVNYPVLGSDGEVMKRALLLSARRGLAPPVLAITVHDSISWDTKDEAKVMAIKEEIEMIPGFRVPFEIKSCFRWE
jgi:DNA polymerase I-like protein with 3'-5' exonuclease and polymerase domains